MVLSRASHALAVAACLLALVGCSVAERPDVASAVSKTIESRLGFAPDVTCEPLDAFAEGASLACTISDSENGQAYAAEVVLVDVRSDEEFSVDLSVHDQPLSESDPQENTAP